MPFKDFISGRRWRSRSSSRSTLEPNTIPNTQLTRQPNRVGLNASSTPLSDPPPYTPSPDSSPAQINPFVPDSAADEDAYWFLKTFDTFFFIDDSWSMAGDRWIETRKALETITPICTQRDADGIDISFLNHRPDKSSTNQFDIYVYKNIKSTSAVFNIFQAVEPWGGTPTGQRLEQILHSYLMGYEKRPDTTKPINIIVITDGAPSDDVESPIIAAAKKLDELDAPAWQVGIQFFQVGNDKNAREHLEYLDDGLAKDKGIRDIIDTVPFSGAAGEKLTADGILKVVLGAVTRRLDRQSKELHQRRLQK